MNEHQIRLLQSMIDLIQSYIDGETKDFYSVIGKLEGALDASEIKDTSLITQLYDVWTPLEIRRALEGNNIDRFKALEELTIMKNFLLKTLEQSQL